MKQELLELATELERKPIVAIDVGTTKISVIIARASFNVDQYLAEGMITPRNLRLIVDGMGVTPSFGMREGSIYNINKVSSSIKRAMDLAKTQVGIEGNTNFQRVLFSVAGVALRKEDISQSISFEDTGHIITREDVRRLFARAKNSATNSSNVIHVIPTEFYVKQGNKDVPLKPIVNEIIGAVGDALIGKFTLVSIDQTNVNTLKMAIEWAGLSPDEVILQPLASTMATATPADQEIGVLVIDIGGGTTDLLYMKNHSIIEVNSIDIAGNTVDHDIKQLLNITLQEARRLKEKVGSLVISKNVRKDDRIDIFFDDKSHPVSVKVNQLIGIIAARYAELFSEDIPEALRSLARIVNMQNYKTNTGLYDSGEISNVILTGGGSNLKGIEVLAAQCFGQTKISGVFRNNVQVRKKGPDMWIDVKQSTVQIPKGDNSNLLIHSTAVGMIVHYIQERVVDIVYSGQSKTTKDDLGESKLIQSIKQWFKGFLSSEGETDNDETF
ncbi:MAG: cell division protein FtsA [Chlorobi bacterium]|nr:cell division protein FtsA [Chlorobiota bacterium]